MIRLDRWLVSLGIGSRTEVQRRIRRGAVCVDGRPVTDPGTLLPEDAALTLDGAPLDSRLARHVMLHKPAGLLTAARDRRQPTVMDLLPPVYPALGCMPVGRLDKDTTGLLLFTTDGELNHRLLSPGRHVNKRYRALAEGRMTEEDVAAFAAGLDLGDFTAQPAELRLIGCSEETGLTTAETVVAEGKFHQVKRMFAATGHEVVRLHRCAFGPLELDPALAEGQWRELTEAELAELRQAAGLEQK